MKSLGGNVVIGTEVELHSLARDDLNGRRGVIVSFDTACRPCLQRAGVKLEGTETPVAIRPQNLREVTAAGAVVSPQSAELSTEPRPPIAADEPGRVGGRAAQQPSTARWGSRRRRSTSRSART